jgi:hypothetical protein
LEFLGSPAEIPGGGAHNFDKEGNFIIAKIEPPEYPEEPIPPPSTFGESNQEIEHVKNMSKGKGRGKKSSKRQEDAKMESANSGQLPVTEEGQIQPTEQENKTPPNAGNDSNNDDNNRGEPNHEETTQPDDIFQSETLIYQEDSGKLVPTEDQTPLNGQDPAPNSLQIEDDIRDPTPGTSTGKIRRKPESKLD